jgi:hypothetical protein
MWMTSITNEIKGFAMNKMKEIFAYIFVWKVFFVKFWSHMCYMVKLCRGVDVLVLPYYQITLEVKMLFIIKFHIYNYFQLQKLITNDKFSFSVI